jgi:hypothetical protein
MGKTRVKIGKKQARLDLNFIQLGATVDELLFVNRLKMLKIRSRMGH